ncbi:MAG: hypothetical protein AB7V46_18995 [Thermomicrobiales bacterium]
MERSKGEHGEEILLSTGKSITQFVIGSMAGVGGGLMGLWFSVHVITTPIDGDMPRWLAVLLGWLCSLFSVALVAIGVFTIGRTTRLMWRRDRLFLGDKHLRCVAQDGRVLIHVPYDNIEEIRFLQDEGFHHGPPDDRVAIILVDPGREDTILRKESSLELDDEEADIIFRDCYQITPRKLYEKLVKRWRRSRPGDRHREIT